MRKLSFFILISFIFIGFVNAATITVTSPHAGDTWYKDSTHNITWTKVGTMDSNVKIRLRDSTSATKILDITNSTLNDGNYSWEIPTSVAPGNYRIRVRTTDSQVYGDSGVFTISEHLELITVIKATSLPMKKPDLKITMHFNPPAPVIGDELTTTVRVVNIGPGESVLCKMRIRRGGETPIPTWDVPALKLGEYSTKIIKWILPGVGYVNWYADVDHEKITSDSNYGNNVVQKKLIVKGPDLIVCVLNSVRPSLAQKETLTAHVKNIGSSRSTPCKLRFYMKNKGTKTFDVPALNEGEVFTASRREKWYTVGRKRITFRVDSDNTVKEANERNNFLETSVLVIGPLKDKYVKSNYVCSNGNSGSTLDSTW